MKRQVRRMACLGKESVEGCLRILRNLQKPRKRNMGKDSLNWKIQNSKGWIKPWKSFWWQYLPPSRSSASRQSAKERKSGQPRQRLNESKNRSKPVSRFSYHEFSREILKFRNHGDSQGAAQGSRGDHRPPRQGQRLKAESLRSGEREKTEAERCRFPSLMILTKTGNTMNTNIVKDDTTGDFPGRWTGKGRIFL